LEEEASGTKQVELSMLHKKNQHVDWEPFLAGISRAKTAIEYGPNRNIFSQGDPADSVLSTTRKSETQDDVQTRQGGNRRRSGRR